MTPLASLRKIYCLDLLDCKLTNLSTLTSLTGAPGRHCHPDAAMSSHLSHYCTHMAHVCEDCCSLHRQHSLHLLSESKLPQM